MPPLNIKKVVCKLLVKFDVTDKKRDLFKKFSMTLIDKINTKDLSLSYAEKILHCSQRYLTYCNNFKYNKPSQYSLEGYLWLHYNQKYNLTYFINYYCKMYKNDIDISKIKSPIFSRPKKSHQILKERVIYILNNPTDKHLTQKYIFDALIGYFHWIYIPKNVLISIEDIKQINKVNFLFLGGNKKFYLPIPIFRYLIKLMQDSS